MPPCLSNPMAWWDSNVFTMGAVTTVGSNFGNTSIRGYAPTQRNAAEMTDEQIDRLCATYAHTDLGNAERFAARYAGQLRWIDSERCWVFWTGKYWKRQETVSVALRAGALAARAIQDEARHIADEDIANKTRKHGRLSESRGAISAMADCAKLDDSIRTESEEFDARLWVLTVANGALDLNANERVLRPHDPADMLTSILPVEYVPSASAPTWERFVTDVLPDAEVRKYVQKWLGYCLTADTSDQSFLFFHGTGANGKGTLIDTIRAVYGDLHTRIHSCVITSGDNDGGAARFGLAPIAGKRLVTFSELEGGHRLNEGLLKDLTGQDPVVIERKNVDSYNIQPIAKYILIGNHKPVVKGDDNSVWRRVRLIPFLRTFAAKDRDPRLREKLLVELPGILNWLLAGYDAFRAEGLEPPAAVVAATDEYRADSDVFGQFLGDRCEINAEKQAPGSDLYRAYTEWCGQNGQRYPLTNKSFASKLKDRGFQTKKTKTSNVWVGLRVLSYSERETGEADDWYGKEEAPPAAPVAPAAKQTSLADLRLLEDVEDVPEW